LLLMMILPSEMDCGVGGMKVEEDAMGWENLNEQKRWQTIQYQQSWDIPGTNLVVLALLMMILPSEMGCGVSGAKVEEKRGGLWEFNWKQTKKVANHPISTLTGSPMYQFGCTHTACDDTVLRNGLWGQWGEDGG
jgi:hypothetical protein